MTRNIQSIAFLLAIGMAVSGCTKSVKDDSASSEEYTNEVAWIDTTHVGADSRNPANNKRHGHDNRRGRHSDAERCVDRIRNAGCYLSNNDAERIERNMQVCKQMESRNGSTELQIIQLRNSDKLVVIKTRGGQRGSMRPQNRRDSVSTCPTTKYTVDTSGIDDLKVLGNHTFMNSKDGQVYFMLPDEQFFELYNRYGYSYRGVTAVKGGKNDAVVIVTRNDEEVVTRRELNERKEERKVRRIDFDRNISHESLFHDR